MLGQQAAGGFSRTCQGGKGDADQSEEGGWHSRGHETDPSPPVTGCSPKGQQSAQEPGPKGPSSQQGARGNDSHGPQVSLPNLRSYLAKGSEKEVGERNLKD